MSKNPPDAHIKVICRMRPLNELEKSQGGQCCVVYNQKTIKLKVFRAKTYFSHELNFFRFKVMKRTMNLVSIEFSGQSPAPPRPRFRW